MACKNGCKKVGWVGHLEAALWQLGAVGWEGLLWGVVQCQVIMRVYGLSSLVGRRSIKCP
jgi:hypothetical protein